MIGRILCLLGRHRWEAWADYDGKGIELCTRPACRGRTWRWVRPW